MLQLLQRSGAVMIKRIEILYSNYQITQQYIKLGTAAIIDNILTNTLIDSRIQSGIIKTDISGHLAGFFLLKTNLEQKNIKKTIIKRDVNKDSMKYFKTIFNCTSSTNDSYNIFFQKFIKIYDQAFPERKNEMKQKSLSSPWISKSLRKSSKRKQRL